MTEQEYKQEQIFKEKYPEFSISQSAASAILKALQVVDKKDEASIKDFAKLVGYFDKKGRFFISEEFKTITSIDCRYPSAAWPLSYWTHAKTNKYRKALRLKCEAACNFEKAQLMELAEVSERTEKRRAVL